MIIIILMILTLWGGFLTVRDGSFLRLCITIVCGVFTLTCIILALCNYFNSSYELIQCQKTYAYISEAIKNGEINESIVKECKTYNNTINTAIRYHDNILVGCLYNEKLTTLKPIKVTYYLELEDGYVQ